MRRFVFFVINATTRKSGKCARWRGRLERVNKLCEKWEEDTLCGQWQEIWGIWTLQTWLNSHPPQKKCKNSLFSSFQGKAKRLFTTSAQESWATVQSGDQRWEPSCSSFGSSVVQHMGNFKTQQRKLIFSPLLRAVLRTNVELTGPLISQFSTERKSWCHILAGWRGSGWITHHKVSSWVRPKGAAALMLQSAMYTVAHMAAGENTLRTAFYCVSADSCESRDTYGGR